ncbi:MAG: hypothetical protein IPJ03_08595 [Ignavibacteriales bacterium]|nr:hypothetical protein [Ignavibacteriales bacterium]
MKLLICLTSIVILTFQFGCSKEEPSLISQVTPSEQGGISLKFDPTNIPDNVISVVATLSREGYDNISVSLNLLSGNDAEILLEEIPVGTWHLKVDALNEDTSIVYSGEADVTILESITAQVYLTLYPTGNGTGSIYIYVTWATSGSGWFDHPANPLLTKIGNSYDLYGVGHSYVLKDDENYKMYYSSLSDNSVTYIYLATSPDGLNWTRYSDMPILYPGNPGSWDQGRCSAGPVIKENGNYKMYYQSFYDVDGLWAIGLATSSDGISWTKYPTPVLVGGSWDIRLRPSELLKIGDEYLLYYTGFSYSYDGEIGLATSTDGIVWTKYFANPIMVPDKAWENGSIGFPSILYDNGTYNMVYQSYLPENTGFGFAYSSDGKSWEKEDSSPFFNTEDVIGDFIKIGWANYRKYENEYRIYYTGFALDDGEWTICVARKFIL